MTCVDAPGKKQKYPHYEHRTQKLDLKDNEFSMQKFYQLRKESTHKKVLKSFERISMCLNGKPTTSLPSEEYDQVCFIIINDYENKHKYELGVGLLNDGYLIALKHHRLGFNVFYLYNPESDECAEYLGYFMKNTQKALTVFYSGRVTNKNTGISFANTAFVRESMAQITEKNYNGKAKVVFLTDSYESGSAFILNSLPYKTMTSISVEKKMKPNDQEFKKLCGIFTYYFYKLITECPDITPKRLEERIEPSLSRFGMKMKCEYSDQSLENISIFK